VYSKQYHTPKVFEDNLSFREIFIGGHSDVVAFIIHVLKIEFVDIWE